MRTLGIPALALLVPLVLLAACGEEDGSSATTDWEATAEVEHRGLAWARGRTIHLGDGATLTSDVPVDRFVVARGGAYVVPRSRDDDPWPELHRVTPDGTEPLGVHPDRWTLTTSSDGRYLAFIDRGARRDQFDTPVAEVVVVDLETGEEVLRSDDDMGDPESDDLADLYEDATPGIDGFVDGALHYTTTGESWRLDLESGETEEVPYDEDAPRLRFDAPREGLVARSPDGRWRIRPGGPRIEGEDQTVVRPRPTADSLGITAKPGAGPGDLYWSLDSWLDDTTAVGTVYVSAGGDEAWVVVTCTVPDGACRAVPGTEGGVVVPVDRDHDYALVPVPLPAG
ncbi:hypothetical protein L615_000700000720 [Nocardioides sp. J9]|uniref:hypothetical protein n=1 Tax=unclassified Nocardioides TaxID=2615069 RepID=UPI00048C1889|nr:MULTISPECIES: hypothetical protein [unclassified Nocardioides]TWG92665.1 hypothetical protein L615_000700000720 [Nocardioides sp. J9]